MLHQFKITTYAIILFLFVISFLLVTSRSDVEAQAGAALDQEIKSLQGMISTLTSRVDALEAQANSAPPSDHMQPAMPSRFKLRQENEDPGGGGEEHANVCEREYKRCSSHPDIDDFFMKQCEGIRDQCLQKQ